MKYVNSLTKAVLSEKAHDLMQKSVFTFMVDKRVNKEQIAKDVQKQFATKVQKVNIIPVPAKKKRVGNSRRFTTVRSGKKKAVVYLVKGENISMLNPKSEKKEKNKGKKEEKQQVK